MSALDSPNRSKVTWIGLGLSFVVLLCLRLPFLPPSLSGLDSINFDLGTHDFDPLAHQPHPPGYPLFIVAAKLAHVVIDEHGTALAVVSAISGAALVFPLWFLMLGLVRGEAGVLATALVVFNPLVWFTSVRPMSDSMGLFVVTTAQALLLTAWLRQRDDPRNLSKREWLVGALVAGLALGVRVQAVVLIGPLLAYGWWRWRETRVATVVWFAVGVALWFVPVVLFTGGPLALVGGFIELVADAVPVEPLLSSVTAERAQQAARDVFVSLWGVTWLAIPMLSLAALGLITMASRDRERLLLIALLFVPYTVYHYLLQMTEVVRYATPIVPLLAVLAIEPLVRWRTILGLPAPLAAASYVVAASVITVPALAAYHAAPSPAAQAVTHLRGLAVDGRKPLVSGHFVFDRYLDQLGSDVRVIEPVPRTEWRRLVDYWKAGGRESILFLSDVKRTSLRLVAERSQTPIAGWRWPAAVEPFLKGSRPAWIELRRIDSPTWFAETGFFLSDEAGPFEIVANEPHRFYIDAEAQPVSILVSGRVLGSAAANIAVQVGERPGDCWVVSGEFTAHAELEAVDARGYIPVTLVTKTPILLTELVVQPAARTVRPSAGFYRSERDEQGDAFRWMGPEATAMVVKRGQDVRLRLQGIVPDRFTLPITVSLTLDDRPLGLQQITSREFLINQDLPAGDAEWQRTLKLTVSQEFVPHDVEGNGDRRRLSLRVYALELEPVNSGG